MAGSHYHTYQFCLRVWSILIFATALVACVAPYFREESRYDAGAAFGLDEPAVDHNVYLYTLFRGSDFWGDAQLCGGNELTFGTWRLHNKEPPQRESLGHCSLTVLSVAQAFAIIAVVASGLAVAFVTVADRSPRVFLTGVGLNLLTFASSLIVICLYKTRIDPTRLYPTYCEAYLRIEPEYTIWCLEETEYGFWTQVACAVLAFVKFIADAIGNRKRSTGVLAAVRRLSAPASALRTSQKKTRGVFSCVVKVLRFLEFALILVGAFGYFAVLSVQGDTPFSGTGVNEATKSLPLWKQQFLCEDNLWWGRFGSAVAYYDNFGNCSTTSLNLVKGFGVAALAVSLLSLAGLKDPVFFPRVYLVGLALETLTLALLAVSIGIYAAKVHPGRTSLDPSYCGLWTDAYGEGQCKIQFGYGFILLCIALGICFVNLSVELLAKDDTDVGIMAARKSLAKSHNKTAAAAAQVREEDEAAEKEKQDEEPVEKEEQAVPVKASSMYTGESP